MEKRSTYGARGAALANTGLANTGLANTGLANDWEFLSRLSREALESIQLRKLQWMLGPVLESNEFYSKKLLGSGLQSAQDLASLDDYRRLPFTTKTEISQDQASHLPFGTNLTFPLERYVRMHQTSGTTGAPLLWLDTPESWDWWARCWETVYRSTGVTFRDRIFFAFSFGPFIAHWSACQGALQIGALTLPGGGMSSYQRLQALLKNEATVLVCTPNYALHLAEVADAEGIDLANSSVRLTIHAGEPGAGIPSTRRRIEEIWGARCYDHAGATEVGAWGFETVERDGLYVNEGEFIAEVLDPVTSAPATEGELVLTSLGRVGMPIIRYRTGDRVCLDTSPSESGLTYIRFKGGVIGRADDALIIRGVNVFPTAVENIVRQFAEITEFAVDVYTRESMDDMVMRIEVPKGDATAVASRLGKDIRTSLGLRVLVEAVPNGSLPRFDRKARRFTDHRKA